MAKKKIKKNPVNLLLSGLAIILSLFFAYNLATAILEARPYAGRPTEVSNFEDYFADGCYGTICTRNTTNKFLQDKPKADATHIESFASGLNNLLLSKAYSAGPGADEKKALEYQNLYIQEKSSLDRYRYSHALEMMEDYLKR